MLFKHIQNGRIVNIPQMKQFFKVIFFSFISICTQPNLLQTPKFSVPQIQSNRVYYTFLPCQQLHWRFNTNTTYVGFNYPQPKIEGQKQFLYINRNGFSAVQWYNIQRGSNLYIKLQVKYKMPIIQTNGTVQVVAGIAPGLVKLKYDREASIHRMKTSSCISSVRSHNHFIEIKSRHFVENLTESDQNGFRLYQIKVTKLSKNQVTKFKKERAKKYVAQKHLKRQRQSNEIQAAQALLMLDDNVQPNAKLGKIQQ